MVNENVKKILEIFEAMTVISIMESSNNYIVSVCDKQTDPSTSTGGLLAVDKKTFDISEFSFFDKPDEYNEACENIIYKYDSETSDELAHWGIKGMRWGVRRYQNRDGSLTPAGKRRRAKMEDELKSREKTIKNRERNKAAYEKLAAKSAELDKREEALRGKTKTKPSSNQNGATPRQKTIGEMTNEELAARTVRMQLEKNYYDAQKNLAAANPPKVSAGQKFTKTILNDVVGPAALKAGKAWAEKFLMDKLGVNEQHKKSIDDLAKEFKLQVDMRNEKRDAIRREIATIEAQQTLNRKRQELAQQEKEAKAQEAAEKAAEKAAKAAERAAKKQTREAERQAKAEAKAAKEAEKAAERARREAEAAAKASPALNNFISKVQNQKPSDLASVNTRKQVQAQLDAGDYDFTNWGRYSRDWDRWDDD